MKYFQIDSGNRLRTIRKYRKLTQENLSEMLDISQKHYSEVERGIAGLSVGHWIQLSEILEVSLDYLLKGEPHAGDIPVSKLHEKVYHIIESSTNFTNDRLLRMMQLAKEIEKQSIIPEYSDKRKTI